ncbi:MAG: hypothetical protein IJS65_03340, partial [Clostridia bacterium]|nr:hypothetical protein [Clostridia bacterium]
AGGFSHVGIALCSSRFQRNQDKIRDLAKIHSAVWRKIVPQFGVFIVRHLSALFVFPVKKTRERISFTRFLFIFPFSLKRR